MAFRKIIIAVDCNDDNERDLVQNMANEISNTRMLKASTFLKMYPLIKDNKEDLLELFRLITEGGITSLLSVRGGKLISKFSKLNGKAK